jgi:hypothetical protein
MHVHCTVIVTTSLQYTVLMTRLSLGLTTVLRELSLSRDLSLCTLLQIVLVRERQQSTRYKKSTLTEINGSCWPSINQ